MVLDASHSPEIHRKRSSSRPTESIASIGLVLASLAFWTVLLYTAYRLLAGALVPGGLPPSIVGYSLAAGGMIVGVVMWLVGSAIDRRPKRTGDKTETADNPDMKAA